MSSAMRSVRLGSALAKALAPIAFASLGFAALAEPSFDCAKARTAAEELICGEAALGEQDAELAAVYKKVLSERNPPDSLEAAQARWIDGRDRACVDDNSSEAEQVTCLSEAYKARIAALKSQLRDPNESLPLCQSMLDDYRALLKAGSAVRTQNPLGPAQDMLAALQAAGKLEIASQLTELRSFTTPDLPSAASFVKSRFHPDKALAERLGLSDDDQQPSGDAQWITHLPETNIFGITALAGTMRCETLHTLFKTTGKRAVLIEGPGYSETECGRTQFGAFGKQPMLIEGNYDGAIDAKNYHLVEGYAIRPWKDGFLPGCNISLRYAPELSLASRDTALPGDNSSRAQHCPAQDAGCAELSEAVLSLIRRYKDNPANILESLFTELGQEGRRSFEKTKEEFDRQASREGKSRTELRARDFASLASDSVMGGTEAIPLINAPLALPLKYQGELLLVLFGHQVTTGSRDLPDYAVSVVRVAGSQIQPVDDFTITLRFGTLEEARVSVSRE